MRAARTGETRTILVQRGENSRVELRDGDGQALLEMPMGLVHALASSDSPRQPHDIPIAVVNIRSAYSLRRSAPLRQVVFDQSYDFLDSIALLHVETGLPLKESRPDAPEAEDGAVMVEGPAVS